jgi:glycosyltransferase involved in cell wall biosynthesis
LIVKNKINNFYILDHPGEAKEMGTRARKLVLDRYTWEKVIEDISKVYQYVLDTHDKK